VIVGEAPARVILKIKPILTEDHQIWTVIGAPQGVYHRLLRVGPHHCGSDNVPRSGSSTFPTSAVANPTLTIAALVVKWSVPADPAKGLLELGATGSFLEQERKTRYCRRWAVSTRLIWLRDVNLLLPYLRFMPRSILSSDK
jgi:hypothetical protein